MLTLFQFPSRWGLPNVSPFCMKMETYLRMANIPYKIQVETDTRKTPNGKFPYIEDDGHVLADTTLIIDYTKKKYGDKLDDNLSTLQKAQALALQSMIEDHLYWTIVYSRWIDPVNFPILKQAFFSRMPFIIRDVVPMFLRRHARRQLYMQGMGRHSQAVIYQFGLQDLAAISTILGEQAFMFGVEPTTVDASAYAFMASLLDVPLASPMKEYIQSQPNLMAYCTRMKQRYYADSKK